MGEYVVKLPDVGEGVAEAEVVEWPVSVGAMVREDEVIAVIMTDKANVEIPSPADGTVLWLAGEIGDTLAVGAPLVRLEVHGEGNVTRKTCPRPRQGRLLRNLPRRLQHHRPQHLRSCYRHRAPSPDPAPIPAPVPAR